MPQPSPSLRTVVVLLVTASLLVGAASGVAGASDAREPRVGDVRPALDRPGWDQQTTPVANNSTVRHRNPDEVRSENRLDALQGVLGGRLEDRLEESSVQLSQGQYEQARSVLGEEYLRQLDKYGDVADERDDDNATSAVQTFNETRDTQDAYAETVEEFRETSDEYRAAKRSGDEQRARELAREVLRLGSEAARQSDRLNESYGRLGNQTGADLTTASAEVQAVQSAVDENRTTIAEAEFVSTTVTVRRADETGSFTDPLTIEATLQSEDGPVSTREIRFDVGQQTLRAETAPNGDFSVSYRPVTAPLSGENLTLQYVPAETSVYSASNATVPVDIEPVTADATIDTAANETAFGDPVTVEGSLSVANEPVTGMPLAVVVDGTRLGTVRTGANGSFAFAGPLPAAPRAGNRTLTVREAVSDRAVNVTSARASVQVRATPTDLSATATRSDAGTTLSGSLTAAGRPVADQRLVVTVAGDRVGTARTNATGAYAVRVDDAENESAVVSFDGDGTNLRSASATVSEPAAADSAPVSSEPTQGLLARLSADPLAALTSPVGLVASGLVLGLAGLGVVAAFRRRDAASVATAAGAGGDSAGETSESTPSGTSSATSPASPDAGRERLFTSATAALDEGTTDEAIIGAYAAVRSALADRLEGGRARTHWQFFDACVAVGVDADPLRTLTEAYETAQYGADETPSSAAERAVTAARALVGTGADSESPAPSDD